MVWERVARVGTSSILAASCVLTGWSDTSSQLRAEEAGKKAPAAATESSSSAAGDVLTIGSRAPELNIEHWLSDGGGKFKPVTKFVAGKVYVVEFWATWCGPCVMSMPHLAETQAKYADQGVQIVSVSDEDLDTVKEFLARKYEPSPGLDGKTPEFADGKAPTTFGELTSAYCLTTDPDMSSSKSFMEAAGQNGIPAAFIVGKTGEVEWIGHPLEMDDPLKAVVAGTWNREEFAKEFKIQQDFDLVQSKAIELVQQGDADGARALLEEVKGKINATSETGQSMIRRIDGILSQLDMIVVSSLAQAGKMDEAIAKLDKLIAVAEGDNKIQYKAFRFTMLLQTQHKDAAAALNDVASEPLPDEMLAQLAQFVVVYAQQSNDKPAADVFAAAAAIAEKVLAKSPENAELLDTLAHLHQLQGKQDEAIAAQTKAVELSPGDAEKAAYLEELKKDAKPKK